MRTSWREEEANEADLEGERVEERREGSRFATNEACEEAIWSSEVMRFHALFVSHPLYTRALRRVRPITASSQNQREHSISSRKRLHADPSKPKLSREK